MAMMLNQDAATSTTTIAINCGNCGAEERRFLHHVRHRGIFRRLCTTCVLRLHPQSFCPTCFFVYETRVSPPLPSNDAVTCFKCYSSSHSSCVVPAPSSPYICPLCTNLSSPIFALNKSEGGKEIDKKSAKILVAAARIAAVSMSKAAVAARAEAERRAKEAAFTRKRAREALEHLASLVTKEKLKKNVGLANVGVPDKNHKAGIIGNSIVANLGEKKLIGIQNRMVDRVDSSSDVLAALNAVELKEKEKEKEKEKLEGVKSQIAVAMEVEEDSQNHDTGNENEKTSFSNHSSNTCDTLGERVGNSLVTVLNVEPLNVAQNNHASEKNVGSQQ